MVSICPSMMTSSSPTGIYVGYYPLVEPVLVKIHAFANLLVHSTLVERPFLGDIGYQLDWLDSSALSDQPVAKLDSFLSSPPWLIYLS